MYPRMSRFSPNYLTSAGFHAILGLRWITAKAHGQALELTSKTMPTTSGIMDSTYRETSRLSSGSEPVARGPAQGRISLAHCAVLWTRLTAG